MTISSIAAAKAAIIDLLTTAGAPDIAGVVAVYPFEPFAGQAQKPVWVTVATEGITPSEYQIAVRVYQSVDVDAAAAAINHDFTVLAVDRAIGSTGRFGPSEWVVTLDQELRALVGTCILQVGREDYWSSTP